MVTLPYPPDWQERPEYLIDRIMRLDRSLPACRGRAAWKKSSVEREIARLRAVLEEVERRAGCSNAKAVGSK